MPTAIALTSAGSSSDAESLDYSSRSQMQRAVLKLYELKSENGGGVPGAEIDSIHFQFNPKEVQIAKQAKWERSTARGAKRAGPPEFKGSEPCKLTLEMFFDATDDPGTGVVAQVEQLFACLVVTEQSSGQQTPTPPLAVLEWGSITSFPAYISSVTAKYTLFSADGTPVRASCSISLEEMPAPQSRQNPTSGGRIVHRAHRVLAGDTLASLSFAEYADPTQWRRLAAYNDIDDPMRIPAGTVILLPPASELG